MFAFDLPPPAILRTAEPWEARLSADLTRQGVPFAARLAIVAEVTRLRGLSELYRRPAILRPALADLARFGGLSLGFIPGMTGAVSAGGGAAPVAPSVVSRNASSTSGATSNTTSLPGSLVSGNLLLVVLNVANNFTATTPSGWSLLSSYTSISDYKHYIYTKTSNGSEGATLTITLSGSTNSQSTAYQISGWQGTPVVGTIATAASGNTPDPPSVAPGWSSMMVLATTGGTPTGTSTTQTVSSYPSGYTNGQIGARPDGTTRGFSAGAELAVIGGSANPGAYTLGLGASWWAQTIAVQGF